LGIAGGSAVAITIVTSPVNVTVPWVLPRPKRGRATAESIASVIAMRPREHAISYPAPPLRPPLVGMGGGVASDLAQLEERALVAGVAVAVGEPSGIVLVKVLLEGDPLRVRRDGVALGA